MTETLRNYIDGAWQPARGAALLDVENPSTGETIAQVPLSERKHLDQAVDAARRAFASWAAEPVARRCEPLRRLAALMREDMEATSRVLTREMGKSLPDSRAEMKRAIENVDIACTAPLVQQGEKLVGASHGIDGEVLRVPVGVFGVIAPFNFPAMVPFWFVPYAVATGNTIMVKPSERVPSTMAHLASLMDRCGFPAGVVNVVHGDRAVAEALSEHDGVDGLSFVGTTRVCRIIAERCARTRKRCQVMGGAKNHLVALPDANMDQVIRNMVTSCYGCAGQRCMAASAIVCVGEATHEEVVSRFVQASREVRVADPLDPAVADEPMVMGPVISAQARRFIVETIEKGCAEGARLALDGRDVRVPGREGGHFLGPTVFTDVRPGSLLHATEIFGPVVVILRAASLDEAIGIINDHPYGNGASLYTQDGYAARRFKLEARAGMIGINVGIPAPVASLPFGGMKDSVWSDIKAQGRAAFRFYTDEKVVTERYWAS